MVYQSRKGEDVSVSSKAGDPAHGNVLDEGGPTERLALPRVAQMELDGGHSRVDKGVADRDAGVRIPARIDHQAVETPPNFLKPADDLPLVVRLEELHGGPFPAGGPGNLAPDLVEGPFPVDLRLPLSQNVEVRAVDEQDAGTDLSLHSISFARRAPRRR